MVQQLAVFCCLFLHLQHSRNCVFRLTHWEQSVIYVTHPVAVKQADSISGTVTILPSPLCQRLIAEL